MFDKIMTFLFVGSILTLFILLGVTGSKWENRDKVWRDSERKCIARMRDLPEQKYGAETFYDVNASLGLADIAIDEGWIKPNEGEMGCLEEKWGVDLVISDYPLSKCSGDKI